MKNFICFFLLVFLSSCATIMEGTKQFVYVNSDPTGAELTVNGRKNYGKTPAQIEINKKEVFNGDHTINYIFEKNGFKKFVYEDKSKINPFSIGGFFVFSFFNIWDWISGAAYKYSGNIFVTLEPIDDDTFETKNLYTKLYIENSFYDIFTSDSISYFMDKIKPESGQKLLSVNISSQNVKNKNKFVDFEKIHLLSNDSKCFLFGIGIPENNKNGYVDIDYLILPNLIPDIEYSGYGSFHSKGKVTGELNLVRHEDISFLHIIESPFLITLFFVVPNDCKDFDLVGLFEQSIRINCDE